MATTLPHRSDLHAAPAGVAAAMGRELGAAVENVDVHNLNRAIPQLVGATATLTRRYGAATATLAARHYLQERSAAGVPGRFTVHPADPAPLPQVTSLVQWATRNLWGPQPDVSVTQRDLVAGAERLVLNVGRRTTVENVLRDRRATGWAREVQADSCAFCALMASRGATYKTEGTAGATTNERFVGEGRFKFHDSCHCAVVPVFGTFEMSATAREADAVYRDLPPGDLLTEFRKAWAARGKTGEGEQRSPKKLAQRDVDADRTTAELQATLARLEASLRKFDSPGARKRVEELRRKIASR